MCIIYIRNVFAIVRLHICKHSFYGSYKDYFVNYYIISCLSFITIITLLFYSLKTKIIVHSLILNLC